MSFVVSSIIEMSMNKIALGTRINVDEWIDERAIIASNAEVLLLLKCLYPLHHKYSRRLHTLNIPETHHWFCYNHLRQ